MWKAELVKYEECIFFLNLSGSSYLSPDLEVQGRTGPVAGAGRESPCPWDRIASTKGSPYPISVAKLPPASHSFTWKRGCVRPGEPRPEFNMGFYCHGKVIFTLTYTELEFINPFKVGDVAVPALVSLFCLLLFNLFHYFVIYWCFENFWEQRNLGALGGTCCVHEADLLDGSGCAERKELVPTISA